MQEIMLLHFKMTLSYVKPKALSDKTGMNYGNDFLIADKQIV